MHLPVHVWLMDWTGNSCAVLAVRSIQGWIASIVLCRVIIRNAPHLAVGAPSSYLDDIGILGIRIVAA
jgi:hypothetical protein